MAVGQGQGVFELTGAVSTEIAFIGALSGTINLKIYVGTKIGVVGRVQLALVAGVPSPFGADLFRLEGDFLLEINAGRGWHRAGDGRHLPHRPCHGQIPAQLRRLPADRLGHDQPRRQAPPRPAS